MKLEMLLPDWPAERCQATGHRGKARAVVELQLVRGELGVEMCAPCALRMFGKLQRELLTFARRVTAMKTRGAL